MLSEPVPFRSNSMENGSDAMRRRLLSSLMESEDEDGNHKKDWVISPLEMFPSKWDVQPDMPLATPWSVQNSQQLFDFRTTASSSRALVASAPRYNYKKDGTSRLRGNDAKELPNIGSSFLFCPSAHANLSPGFVELSNHDAYPKTSTSPMEDAWPEEENTETQEEEPKKPKLSRMTDLLSSFGITSLEFFNLDTKQVNFQTQRVEEHFEEKGLIPRLKFAGSHSNNERSILGGDDPYMTILLPLSAMSGGIHGINDDGPSNRWVELGCQVKSARIVDGVDFVPQPTDNDGTKENPLEEEVDPEEVRFLYQ